MQAPKKKMKIFLKRGEGGGIDLVFLLLVLVLLAFGLVMVASSSYVNALHNYKDSYYFIKRQLIWALVGIVVIFVASRMDYHVLRRKMLWILGISILFLILVYTPLGIKVNGARRWLGFGPISFQPSELAKLAVIIALSAYITALGKRMKEFKIGILFPGLLLVVVCGLVAFETHISGAILIFLIGIVLIVVGGVSLKWFGSLAAAGTAALAGFAFLTPYAKTRIDTWLDPFIDPTGAGFQTIQSLYAIGSGGLFGKGLGLSRQKYLYIPEPQNDYIFSIICEELGFLGALLVIALFIMLIWRGFYIAYHAKDKFGSLLVIGIVSRVAIQAILNIAVVTNAIPPTGISLPFFSYGGTSLLLLLFEMGIVLAVSRQSRMENHE